VSTITFDPTSPLADLAQSFIRSLKGERRSPHTIDVYARAILEYDRFAAANDLPRDVQRIRRAHVEAFLEDQIERRRPATASIRYAGLHRFLAWCLDEQEISVSPMEKMRPPKVPETMPMVLSDEQMHAILTACDGPTFRQRRDRTLLGIMADTGCRRSEVAGIKVADVDRDEQTIRVTGKGSKTRIVSYSTATAIVLDRYFRVRDKHKAAASPLLWLGAYGALSSDSVADIVVRRASMAGVTRPDGRPIHAHLFRHRFADRWLSKGGNESDLLEIGGWSDSATMRKYGRGRRQERAIDAARRMFGEPA
jgi:site-specific recombinase XerD